MSGPVFLHFYYEISTLATVQVFGKLVLGTEH